MPGGCFGVSPANSMDHTAVGYASRTIIGFKSPKGTRCVPYSAAAAPDALLHSLDTQTRGIQHLSRNDSQLPHPAHAKYLHPCRQRDVGKACIFTAQKRFVKTHALSLLGTTRLLSRNAGATPALMRILSNRTYFLLV